MTPERPLSVVEEQLGSECVAPMETLLSAHATHLIDGPKAGLGIMLEGTSGTKKTTLLKSFYGLEEQVYRSDQLTPQSFVSHDASKSDEELEDIDLLPRITDKTLICSDMGSWFEGKEETIGKNGLFSRGPWMVTVTCATPVLTEIAGTTVTTVLISWEPRR